MVLDRSDSDQHVIAIRHTHADGQTDGQTDRPTSCCVQQHTGRRIGAVTENTFGSIPRNRGAGEWRGRRCRVEWVWGRVSPLTRGSMGRRELPRKSGVERRPETHFGVFWRSKNVPTQLNFWLYPVPVNKYDNIYSESKQTIDVWGYALLQLCHIPEPLSVRLTWF